MANDTKIIIPRIHQAGGISPIEAMAEDAAHNNFFPVRIKCPECARVYTLFVEDPNQGLHTLLGQACPYCKKFITEKDDPEKLLVDLKEIRDLIKKEK